MKAAAYLLIALGMLVLLYPLADRAAGWYAQERLLETWENGDPGASAGERTGGEGNDALQEPAMAALLRIEAIELEVPVLRGATEANLRAGAGLYEGGAEPGQAGNAIIAAHRSHTYGRLFNRLDELKPGDSILLETRDENYRYQVFDTRVIRPQELPPARVGGEDRELTLVTCHPLYSPNPPERLVVKARLP